MGFVLGGNLFGLVLLPGMKFITCLLTAPFTLLFCNEIDKHLKSFPTLQYILPTANLPPAVFVRNRQLRNIPLS